MLQVLQVLPATHRFEHYNSELGDLGRLLEPHTHGYLTGTIDLEGELHELQDLSLEVLVLHHMILKNENVVLQWHPCSRL